MPGWAKALLCLIIAAAIVALVGTCSAAQKVPQGEIGYGVGGGTFLDADRNKVNTGLLEPGTHITGTLDGLWTFPSNKTVRFLDYEAPVTTRDGKKMLLTGQVGFRFVGESDQALTLEFVKGIGSRKYDGNKPGENAEGWEAFLDQLVLPEVNAALREQFGRVYCADFEPSCRVIDPRDDVPLSEPDSVYTQVADSMEAKVEEKLGGHYLQSFVVRVKAIDLQEGVQRNIDAVAEQEAATQAAQQSVKTAEAEAEAIRIKGEALRANRDLVSLEIAKECAKITSCSLIVDPTGEASASVPVRP